MNPLWLLRLKRWVQHPPSKKRVWLVLGVIAICTALYLIERSFGWPDWLSATPRHGRGYR